MVARARRADNGAVDGHTVTETADSLAANSGDALQQRNAGRKVMPFGEQSSQFRRRQNRDALADVQACPATDGVEPGRHARGRIPHRVTRDRNGQRRECGGRDEASQDETARAHGNSALRWSQARWRSGE